MRILLLVPALLLTGCAGCGEEDPKPAGKPAPPVPLALRPATGSGPDVVLDSFNGIPLQPPTGWSLARGRWILAEDISAARGPTVLSQEAPPGQVADWAVALRDGVWSGDFSAEVRFKPVSGKEGASGGLVVLAQDADNYYVCRANALEGNFRLYIVQAGRRIELESAEAAPPGMGTWHSLRVSRSGGVLECAMDGKILLTHPITPGKEPAWATGRVGLWTKADSVTRFDDLSIIRIPEVPKGDPP